MELGITDGLTAGSVIGGIFSGIILTTLAALWAFGSRFRIGSKFRFYVTNTFYGRVLSITAISLASGYSAEYLAPFTIGKPVNFWIASLVTAVISLLFLYFKFSSVGIEGAQRSVASGTNYHQALSLCENGFWFLGTGASKLTHEANFVDTIRRCNRTPSSVRFLLARPNMKALGDAERSAGVTPNAYSHAVKESLKVLKRLREDRSCNFEVRFYGGISDADDGRAQVRDVQYFRMMIIDNTTLLLSYNVYGINNKGSELPQLVISNGTLSEHSFIRPFVDYYQSIWIDADEWDFEKYL